MATPDRAFPNLPQAVNDLQKRVTYIDQRSVTRLAIIRSSGFATGGGLTTTPANKTGEPIPVPTGYTSVMVALTVSAQVKNTRGVSDNLRVKPNIAAVDPVVAGVDGFSVLRLIQAGTMDSVSETMNHWMTGLIDGQSIVVSCYVWADGGTWTADVGNSYAYRAALWFMR